MKFATALIVLLALTVTANCGFDDFLNKVNNGLDKFTKETDKVLTDAVQVIDAVDATVKTGTEMVDKITKDVEILSKDIRTFTNELQHALDSVYANGKKIYRTAIKYYGETVSDAKQLVMGLKGELTTIIEGAEASMRMAIDEAKQTISQVSADAKITYKDGKLVITDVKGQVSEAVAALKAKNKEALQNVVDELNLALATGQKVVADAKVLLETIQKKGKEQYSNGKDTVMMVKQDIRIFITKARATLKQFKESAQDKFNHIVGEVENLARQSQKILSLIEGTAGKVTDTVTGTVESVDGGFKDIKDIWGKVDFLNGRKTKKEEPKVSVEDKVEADLKTTEAETKAKIEETIKKGKELINKGKDSVDKTKEAIDASEKLLKETITNTKKEMELIKKINKGTPYFCNTYQLNIRKGPGTNNPVIGMLKQKDEVQVLSIENGWAKLGDNKYVAARYLTKIAQTATPSDKKSKKIQVVIKEQMRSAAKAIKNFFKFW